jgi:hypothetical protein
MPAYDAGFKIVARASGRELAAVGGVACEQWTPIVSEVQTTERLADRAFRARRGRERFLVYMEAYTYWTSTAPWSILSKSALLSERERLPTISLVYILRPRGYQPQSGHFQLRVEEGPTQQVWFREVCLWQVEPEAWWDGVPGLMALSPLCRQDRSAQAVVGHAAEAIAAHACDTIQRADLLTTLAIFGRLAYPQIDVLRLVGREQMKESKVYDQIMEEGRVESRREDILAALEIRFGLPAAKEFTSALDTITDNARLARLHRLALRSSSVEEFRDRFPKVRSQSRRGS